MRMRAKMTISREELEKLLTASSGPNFVIKDLSVKTKDGKIEAFDELSIEAEFEVGPKC